MSHFVEIIQELISQINTREWSILFWLLVFFVFVLFKMNIGKQLLEVFKAFKPLVLFFTFEFSYVLFCIFILSKVGFWDINLLKDTIIVTLTTIFLVMRVKREDVAKDKNILKKLVLENLTFAAIIQFVIDTYTFNIIIELVLVPLIVVISLLSAVAQSQYKDQAVNKFFKWINISLGFTLVAFAIFSFFNNPFEVFSLESVKSLLFPFIITLMFIPLLYMILLFSTYQWYLTSWHHVLSTNLGKKEVYKKLRNAVLIKYHFRLWKFLDFYETNRLKIFDLEQPTDVKKMLDFP